MLSRLTLMLALALASASGLAGTAPWYKWRSQVDSQLTCAQFSPGQAWVRFQGPYDNPACR